MAASLGELFIELGVFADTKELNAFEEKLEQVSKKLDDAGKKANKTSNSLKGFIKGVAGVATAIGGAVFALNKLTESLVNSNQEFLNLTRTSDVALGTFQKWNNIGKMFGVNNAAQQIANLNERLYELKLTGQGAQGFMLAGINPMGQSAEGVMEQLRNRVAGLDDTAAAYLLRQLGLDPSMLHLLRLGRKEFEELGKTVDKYRLTEDQSKQIQALNAQLQIAQIKFKYLKDRAILAIMPYFVRFMESLARVTEMLLKAGKHVGSFVVKWRALVGIIAIGLSKIKPVATFFTTFGKAISELIIKIPVFGRFLGALGGVAAKALLPFTALYLLLDDLAVFFQGGDSLIGRVLEWGKEKGGQIGEAFKKMFGGDFFGGVGELADTFVDVMQKLLEVALRIVDILLGTSLKVTITKTLDWVKAMSGAKTQEEFDDIYRKFAPDWAKSIYLPQPNNLTTTNNDNRQVTMHNTINTTQAGQAVSNELAYVQNWAFG